MVRPAARRLRRLAWTLLSLAVLAMLLAWAWGRPFMAPARMLWDISRAPAPTALPVPVEGVRARQVADTFGAPRGRDRTHQGVDIFARRGTPVVSATRGIVVSIRDGGLGASRCGCSARDASATTTRTWTTGRPAWPTAKSCTPVTCWGSSARPAMREARHRTSITASMAPLALTIRSRCSRQARPPRPSTEPPRRRAEQSIAGATLVTHGVWAYL